MFPNWIYYILGKKSGGGGDTPTPTPTSVVIPQGMKFGKSSVLPEDFGSWDFSNITDFTNMFYYSEFTELPTFDVSSGTNFHWFFYNNTHLLKVNDLDFVNGTNFTNFFDGCTNLKNIGTLTFHESSNQIDLSYFFKACRSIEEVRFNYIGSGITKFSFSTFLPSGLPLSDESLNSLLGLLVHATTRYNIKNFGYVDGLSNYYSRLPSLPNYQACLDAGWTPIQQ